MSFTAKDVKELRDRTGCGMMDCKNALKDADGDFDKAIEILREKGLAKAAKKAGRVASDGMVYALADKKNKLGAIVEVNSETDFVAKNDIFRKFVEEVAHIVMEKNPATVEELLSIQTSDGVTVEDDLTEKIQVIGENIKIRRFERYEGVCVAYVHAGGTHAALVNFDVSDDVFADPEFETYGKNVAMQVVSMNPPYLDEASVPNEVIENEKKIMAIQIENDPSMAKKPQAVREKIVSSKVSKYYKENCLLDQAYVQDDSISVSEYTKSTAKRLGGDIKIVRFVRYEKGEGIEKKSEDFASEIADMVK